MPERTDRLRNHIKAAREWLCKAEHSLDEDNKVKGNLNLMLAQAELQRAKESKSAHGNQRGVLSLAPLALALLLAFSGYYFITLETQTVQSPLRTAVEEHTVTSVPHQAVSELNTVSVAPPATLKEAPVTVPEVAVGPVVSAPEPLPSASAVTVNAVPAAVHEAAGQVPPIEMQKLMRAAGKSLRAQ